MQFTQAFSVWDGLHYEGGSGGVTRFNSDRLELYSNHISQNNLHECLEMETDTAGVGGGGSGCVTRQRGLGDAQDAAGRRGRSP